MSPALRPHSGETPDTAAFTPGTKALTYLRLPCETRERHSPDRHP